MWSSLSEDPMESVICKDDWDFVSAIHAGGRRPRCPERICRRSMPLAAGPFQKRACTTQPPCSRSFRALGLRPLGKILFIAKLAAGGFPIEAPVDLDSRAVHSAIPCPGFCP